MYRTEIPYITTLQVAESESGLKKTSEKIIDILRANPAASYKIISEELGITRSAIAKHINNLQKANKIRRVGPDNGGHWEVID